MYLAGLSAGGMIEFAISLKNVDHFTGASLTMTSTSGEWQMKSISVNKLTSLSKRYVEWSGTTIGKLRTDRTIYRAPVIKANMLFYETPLLLKAQTTKSIETSSGGEAAAAAESDVDWSDMRFSMSYEQTAQNLGFTKRAATIPSR